jgi:hypothetical protein
MGKRPPPKSARPKTTADQAAERARMEAENKKAHDAQASVREHMVDIGRGEQQAGRGGEARKS